MKESIFIYTTEAICATCGSQWRDAITGYCQNDHDDWLEAGDPIDIWERCSENTGLTISEIKGKLEID